MPLLAIVLPATAEEAGEASAPTPAGPAAQVGAARVCPLIETEAAASGLPEAFLVRLIWRESRFDPNAVSHKGAQGIAQFMPATAAERGLDDPFDPLAAIPASARLLADLAQDFGNLGLAAAAYNAGARRVGDWLAGRGGLPLETRDYVRAITGREAEEWKSPDTELGDLLPDGADSVAAWCLGLPTRTTRVALAAPAAAPRPPWGVQVAANHSRARALAAFDRVRRAHAAVIGGQEPVVVRQRVAARGPAPLHTVRVGAESQAEARRLCERLRGAGGACLVARN